MSTKRMNFFEEQQEFKKAKLLPQQQSTSLRYTGESSSSKVVPSPTTKPTKKKLTISEFRDKPKLDNDFEEECWSKLKIFIHAVYNREPVVFSQQEL